VNPGGSGKSNDLSYQIFLGLKFLSDADIGEKDSFRSALLNHLTTQQSIKGKK